MCYEVPAIKDTTKESLSHPAEEEIPYFFVPAIEYPDLLRYMLTHGLKMVKTMNILVKGVYQAPTKPYIYLPSIGGM
jgi:hypothetical protein